jgi:protein SCO1
MKLWGGIILAALLLSAGAAAAQIPPAAREVEIDEHLGQPIDKEIELTDEAGARVRLGDYLSDGKPLLLVLAYYRCPMLCGLVLRGAALGLKGLDTPLGRDFRALTVSIDPRDTPAAAAEKQRSTMAFLGRPEGKNAWPFLVGEEASIKALAGALGFRYAYDPRTLQYAHPAVVFALTPDGRISRYLYGTSFSPRDLRLALVEASAGKTGSIVDRILVTCYRYDPASRRYSPYIVGFLRLGGALILVFVTGLLAVLWIGERRRRRALLSRDGGEPG